jgi:hypothetical protein
MKTQQQSPASVVGSDAGGELNGFPLRGRGSEKLQRCGGGRIKRGVFAGIGEITVWGMGFV